MPRLPRQPRKPKPKLKPRCPNASYQKPPRWSVTGARQLAGGHSRRGVEVFSPVNDLSLICSNDETNPTRRRGAQPGLPGLSARQAADRQHQRPPPRPLFPTLQPPTPSISLGQPPDPQDADPNAHASPLLRHLAILQAASEGQGAAIPLLAAPSAATPPSPPSPTPWTTPTPAASPTTPKDTPSAPPAPPGGKTGSFPPKASAIAALAPELPPRMLRRTSICIFHGAGGNRHGQLL